MELRNNSNTLSRMQGNFPHIYDVYNDKTILYALLSIYASKYDLTREIIDRIYGMIGIETTYDEDLEHRWGSMLGIYKEIGESYDDYRERLMIVYASFSGGTAEAIKYAVAVTVGISTEKSIIDKYINIIDAWEYDHELIPHDTDPKYDVITNNTNCLTNTGFILNKPYDAHKDGAFVCTIDLSINESIHYYKDKIMTAINKTKASGINAYLVFLYISNEIADVVRHSDTETMVIRESSNDECTAEVNDKLVDTVKQTIHEVSKMHSSYSSEWSRDGLNTNKVLNISFKTNMLAETDAFSDIIIKGGIRYAVQG